ncbi:3beta-hydroxysteroid-dehydrogenase/decarboxylase isoform 1 [Porphyridium purpureum]|uniref:3beta-hydroxysteroid-dehydrogenase/decarboxylase isoform 1 n=1 Tax=Porphyridium purpureum TaxID=35688 RepID=A0A5J4YK84_PORPP|nr:3beta-hydroxysteroid-dehydrogenase/decarboxylase isoform 1 [Porphyridium purpureum]|eukprot:POR3713..scf261_15
MDLRPSDVKLAPAPGGCLVTGAAGLCGRRLVEMLSEAGAKLVVGFDRAPQPTGMHALKIKPGCELRWVQGDLAEKQDVMNAFESCKGEIDCVFHMAALVGPYHAHDAYYRVNYHGTLHVIDACRKFNVRNVVMSSSPSTRMDGSDVVWKREDELSIRPPGQFLEAYAESKAMGEEALRQACDGEKLLAVIVAPHQVYGPFDNLFLPNFLRRAKSLRIFGDGENKISLCYVDNYCHALILGSVALFPGSPVLGKFYIATDGPPQKLWYLLDRAITELTPHPSLFSKTKVPYSIMMGIARICQAINGVFGTSIALRPFVVKMLTIERTFNIANIQTDFGYQPLYSFDEAFPATLNWYANTREFWDTL